ncbi:MAG: hypothetical protein ICV55_07375, partial [Coleofasciculus sp. C3-bin4]|nr:hypothetical protein [Coleofasciculus sp. C3-bin4]
MTTTTNRAPSFDIREHLDKLTPAKGKNRYICPVCKGNNLTIAPETGKYRCWNECDCKDIREAVSPWDKVKGNDLSDRIRQDHKPKPPTPALIPEISIELAKLPDYATHPEKRKRGCETNIEYTYSDTQWVERTEKPDPEKPKG